MNLKLMQFEHDGFDQIKGAWLEELDPNAHEVFLAEYEQLFSLIEDNCAWGDLKSQFNKPVYQSVADDHGKSWAIVEIVQSKRGSEVWVKMMDITMCPKIEVEQDSGDTASQRLRVFIAALMGIFRLTGDIDRANTVKVYGRTDLLVTFLRGMHSAITTITSLGTIPGITVSIEGRWLVFRANQTTR